MGLLQNVLRTFRLRLTEQDQEVIWKQLGSFRANMFGMDDQSLISHSYEKNADIFAVIKRIVDVSKAVPWIVEQYSGGRWKELKDTPFHELMEAPNSAKGYTWDDVEEMILIYLLCTGNAYMLGQQGIIGNQIQEIEILPSPFISIETNEDFFLPSVKYKFQFGKNNRTYQDNELAHLRFFNPAYSSVADSMYGLSIIQVAANLVQVGNDRTEAMAALYQNRGAIGMITDKSNRPMDSDDAKNIQQSLDQKIGGPRNAGRISVTNKDLSYIPLVMNATDLQLVNSGVVTLRSICNVFGLDSSLFNDPDNKTYNNRLEAEKAFYTNAIMPLSQKVGEWFTGYLGKNLFPGKKIRIRQDFTDIECLQESFNTKANTYVSLVQAGIMKPETAAEWLGIENKPLNQ